MGPGICQEGFEEIPNGRVLRFDRVAWALGHEEKERISIRRNSLEKSLVGGEPGGLCEALGEAGQSREKLLVEVCEAVACLHHSIEACFCGGGGGRARSGEVLSAVTGVCSRVGILN